MQEKTVTEGKVVKIDFYTARTLPKQLGIQAKKQNKCFMVSDVIAVKTIIPFDLKGSGGPAYEFVIVDPHPEGVQKFMQQLALEDGANLWEAVEKAFGSE
jgi:hypothetical protein